MASGQQGVVNIEVELLPSVNTFKCLCSVRWEWMELKDDDGRKKPPGSDGYYCNMNDVIEKVRYLSKSEKYHTFPISTMTRVWRQCACCYE